MTPHELYVHLIHLSGESVEKPLPRTFEVDKETYANVCQAIFDTAVRRPEDIYEHVSGLQRVIISLGENNGIMFKGVELRLKI